MRNEGTSMKPPKTPFSAWVLLLALLSLSNEARAETCEKWVARVVSTQGGVQSLRAGERQWRPVKLHETYCPGDRIRVLARSRADIILFNVLVIDAHRQPSVAGAERDVSRHPGAPPTAARPSAGVRVSSQMSSSL